MGTFSTDPFGSDGALDLLEELAERPVERRHEALRHRFSFVVSNPDLLWREFFPDEIVASAAIVAASLPGGEDIRQLLVELVEAEVAQDANLPMPAPDLARPALEALLLVAGPGGPWHQGWTAETDTADARQTTDNLTKILRAASA